jgi:hypothetical protein
MNDMNEQLCKDDQDSIASMHLGKCAARVSQYLSRAEGVFWTGCHKQELLFT